MKLLGQKKGDPGFSSNLRLFLQFSCLLPPTVVRGDFKGLRKVALGLIAQPSSILCQGSPEAGILNFLDKAECGGAWVSSNFSLLISPSEHPPSRRSDLLVRRFPWCVNSSVAYLFSLAGSRLPCQRWWLEKEGDQSKQRKSAELLIVGTEGTLKSSC